MAKTFTVERTATIPAPPSTVYGLVVDFHEWRRWSPWDDRDPSMHRTYAGADSGVGARYAWDGNRDVGQGGMEITRVVENERIELALSFVKPFKSENTTLFTFAPDGDGTRVTWRMTGPKSFLMTVMGLFMNMDKMIGQDFELGFDRMSAAVRDGRTTA